MMREETKKTPLEEAWEELEKEMSWDNIYNFLREYLRAGGEGRK